MTSAYSQSGGKLPKRDLGYIRHVFVFPVEYMILIINPSGATLAPLENFFYSQKSKMAANLYIVKN